MNQPVFNKLNFDQSPLSWEVVVTWNSIKVSWERRAGVVEYILAFASGNPWGAIYQGPNTTFTHENLEKDTEHFYFISGKSADGEMTTPVLVRARTAVRHAPVTPSYIRAVDKKEDSVLIIWEKGEVDGGVPSYLLTRDGVTLDRPKVEEFRDSRPEQGREHVYCIHTVDDEYNESPAICVAVKFDDFTAPTDPSNLHVEEVRLKVKWTPVYDSSDKVTYKLFVDDVEVGVTADSEFVFTGLQSGRQYKLSVMAFDESGNQSNVVSINYPELGIPLQKK